MSDFLSQDEIDALLGSEKKESVKESKEKKFDINRFQKIQKGGFGGLELLFEKWTKIVREEIRIELPVINMISKGKISVMRFGDYLIKIPLPASYTIFAMKPLKESALLVIDSRVVFNLVSAIFGGGAKPFKIEGREFTKLEMRIVEKLVDIVLTTFEKIWQDVYSIEIERKSIELNPFLVRIIPPSEKVIVAEILVDIEGVEVPFTFAFPQMLFLPIKDIIYSENLNAEIPKEWINDIIYKILRVKLKTTLELDKIVFSVREILKLEKGNEIILNKGLNDELNFLIENKVKFKAKLGKIDKKFAAMIVSKIEKEKENG